MLETDFNFIFLICQLRSEVLDTLRKLLIGLGVSSASCHKDIYKCVRTFLVDRSLFVRCSAAKVSFCLQKIYLLIGVYISMCLLRILCIYVL